MPAAAAPTISSEKIRITVTKLNGSSAIGMSSARSVCTHSTCGGRRAPLTSQGSSPTIAPPTPTGRATVHAHRHGSSVRVTTSSVRVT